jgi:curli biogenesis system outer membrane secretion channel CsgG
MGTRVGRILLLTTVITSGIGCSSSNVFVHPDADLTYYERVGVVPFLDLSGQPAAGEKMTTAFTSALLARGVFEVAEPGAFREILRNTLPSERRGASELTPEELKKVAEAAGVQGIFEGRVRDYEMVRMGQASYPLITLEVRLLDATTGIVVWSTSVTKRGGPKIPILGWGEVHTLGELANDVAAEAVKRLPW